MMFQDKYYFIIHKYSAFRIEDQTNPIMFVKVYREANLRGFLYPAEANVFTLNSITFYLQILS